MFKDSKTIIKIDGRNVFVDVQEAFALDKVCFQFRVYDETKQRGSRISNSIDFYMNMEELGYFCHILKTGRLARMIQAEINAAGNGYPKPGYVKFGGTNKPGEPVISRKLQVEAGKKAMYLLSALQGPGKVGTKGQIQPMYMDKDAQKISIPLTEELATKLAIAGERAIGYYDAWCAAGTLEQHVERLRACGQKQAQQNTQQRQQQSAQRQTNYRPVQQAQPQQQAANVSQFPQQQVQQQGVFEPVQQAQMKQEPQQQPVRRQQMQQQAPAQQAPAQQVAVGQTYQRPLSAKARF